MTAGLDFALTLVAQLRGEDVARRLTLELEYDPAPPFDCGHPDRADAELLAQVRQREHAWVEQRRVLLTRS